MLEIDRLSVAIEGVPILKNLSLKLPKGEVHAIMGPNGAGKSTLAKVVAGDPAYEVTHGSLLLDGIDLLELSPDERSLAGLFISFQYPPEIPGVNNLEFLHLALNAQRRHHGQDPLPRELFEELLDRKLEVMQIKSAFKERNLNEGFSGGEKKRNEILQLALLEPKIALLDETDSGLDIDALRLVGNNLKALLNPSLGILLITHYQRLLESIIPDVVHIMVGGEIVESGGRDLAISLDARGYQRYMEKQSH